MSICSLRWFAEDMVNVGRWLVRETADEVHARFWKALERLDTHVQPSHVRRAWDGMLAEEQVARVHAEAVGVTECVEEPWHDMAWDGRKMAVALGHNERDRVWQHGNARQYRWNDIDHTWEWRNPQGGEWRPCTHGSWGIASNTWHPFVDITDAMNSPAAGAPVPPPEVADEGPSVVEHSPAPTEGHPNELADLIAEVLADHVPKHPSGFNPDGTGRTACPHHYRNEIGRDFPDWAGWRDHVAPLIAERIEKAAPPVAFSDLSEAAYIISHRAQNASTDRERARLESLALRLREGAVVALANHRTP